jgi:peptidylprolyl isomerase
MTMKTIIFIFLISFLTLDIMAQSGTDFITTPSGLKYKITSKGKGVQANPGDKVTLHYTGKLTNDTIFDTSYKRGQPFSFVLGRGQVIKGWDEGVGYLHQGDKATFIIPPELGYGNQQAGKIPPSSTLIFDVELVQVSPEVKVEPYDTKGKDTLKSATGLKYIVVSSGPANGVKAMPGCFVSVHYTGYFEDGKIFDSSVKRGEPLKFELGSNQVIKGWDEGISLMKTGDKLRLLIPWQLAYGEQGRPPAIPPKSNLIFDVELISVVPGGKVEAFNTKGKDTVTTASGLKYIVVTEGKKDAVRSAAGKTVTVHYTGYLDDGKIFDSSVKRNEPIQFILGKKQVIPGWEEGIGLMKVGDKFRFLIPYQLAYGEKGYPGVIPEKARLTFDVELINVSDGQ